MFGTKTTASTAPTRSTNKASNHNAGSNAPLPVSSSEVPNPRFRQPRTRTLRGVGLATRESPQCEDRVTDDPALIRTTRACCFRVACGITRRLICPERVPRLKPAATDVRLAYGKTGSRFSSLTMQRRTIIEGDLQIDDTTEAATAEVKIDVSYATQLISLDMPAPEIVELGCASARILLRTTDGRFTDWRREEAIQVAYNTSHQFGHSFGLNVRPVTFNTETSRTETEAADLRHEALSVTTRRVAHWRHIVDWRYTPIRTQALHGNHVYWAHWDGTSSSFEAELLPADITVFRQNRPLTKLQSFLLRVKHGLTRSNLTPLRYRQLLRASYPPQDTEAVAEP